MHINITNVKKTKDDFTRAETAERYKREEV